MPGVKNNLLRFVVSNAVCVFVALLLFILGFTYIWDYKLTMIITKSYFKNYVDCEHFGKPCKYATTPCFCDINFKIEEKMKDTIGLYYETYNQTWSDYKTSKDDKQLAGILSKNPASSCGDYAYDKNGTPIVPCGAIADSMFLDSFFLMNISSDGPFFYPMISTGLDGITEEDKKLFRNPPGDLKEAFKNFSKPKSWKVNIWELDKENMTNNGLQNERFIAWMKTDLKRKPFSRLDNTRIYKNGLPAGNYTVRVYYRHKFEAYSGPRIVILAFKNILTSYQDENVVIGILCIAVVILLFTDLTLKYKFTSNLLRSGTISRVP